MNIEFDEGYQAYQAGKQLTDNPYKDCGCVFKERNWVNGWEEAKDHTTSKEILREAR